jgi:hypothetical protein
MIDLLRCFYDERGHVELTKDVGSKMGSWDFGSSSCFIRTVNIQPHIGAQTFSAFS